MHFFFYTRMFLYLLAFGLPIFHPSIAVPYDRVGWWMWFFLLPGEMLISYYLAPPRLRARTWILTAFAFSLILIVIISGFSLYSIVFLGVGLASFFLTALIFKTGSRGYPFAVLEQFFLGFLYYKMLSFSRASEAIARESYGITRVILVLIVFAFLLHGMVLYFSAYHQMKKKGRFKEVYLFLTLTVPVSLLITLALPMDFVSHSSVFNILKQEPEPQPIPLDETGDGLDSGNLLSRRQWWNQKLHEGEMDGEGQSTEEGQGMLEGVPSDEWFNEGRGKDGDNRQYAVLIIASSIDPVYMADGYFEEFDPQRGFLLSTKQKLNDLIYLHLLETWKDSEHLSDLKRYPHNIFYLSTIPDRVLPYRPYMIQPTVFNKKYHPFDYSYRGTSMMSISTLEDWVSVRDLSEEERHSLEDYLEINLNEPVRDSFVSYLENAIQGKTGYFERILAIFESFSSFHYELGFADDVSVLKMEEFLTQSRRGDCTEFSNTTAMLTRLAGIPSRVVTGYLASKNLQTFAHMRGLFMLRNIIEPLKEFPFRDLYLVTTAHRHSWVQIYMPGYGWVDFDPTSFAIPPVGIGNPNSMNVVIPLIQITEDGPVFKIPWLLILQMLILLSLGILLVLYIYHYGRELYLKRLSVGTNQRALNALYTLLLIKLSSNGYILKSRAETPLEYAKLYPELRQFASIFTTLRFRKNFEPGEEESLWHEIRVCYSKILNECKKQGLHKAFRRFFSLRGLYYKW